ncbi:MAG: alpha/beta hydrolase, partial [Nitriliruptorales bacterium]
MLLSLGVLVAVLVVLVGALWGFQRRLVYLPYGAPPAVEEGLPGAEAVTITTADRLELDAWFLASGPTAVAFFPGNAGNRSLRAPLARALADEGLSVLLLDYRGYGGNPGRPSEQGLT